MRKAVPPNPVDFVESTGLAAVAYGPDSHEQMDDDFARNVWKMQNPISLVRGFKQYNAPGEAEVSAPLTSLTDGADLLLTPANSGRLPWCGLIGSRRAGEKLATDARHDRSPRAGVSAKA